MPITLAELTQVITNGNTATATLPATPGFTWTITDIDCGIVNTGAAAVSTLLQVTIGAGNPFSLAELFTNPNSKDTWQWHGNDIPVGQQGAAVVIAFTVPSSATLAQWITAFGLRQ